MRLRGRLAGLPGLLPEPTSETPMNAALAQGKESPPVTVTVTRRVKPGREAAFEAWLHGVIQAATAFPGHRGANVFRPADPEHPEYVLVFQFARQADLDRWTQ